LIVVAFALLCEPGNEPGTRGSAFFARKSVEAWNSRLCIKYKKCGILWNYKDELCFLTWKSKNNMGKTNKTNA